MKGVRRAVSGTSEVVADDCTDVIYAGGMYHLSLTLECPVDLRGTMETRAVPIVLTPRGLWALQHKLLNAPKGRGRLDG